MVKQYTGGSYEEYYNDDDRITTPEEEYSALYHDTTGYSAAVRRCKCGHARWHHGMFFTSCTRDECSCRKYIEYLHAKEGIYD